MPDNVELDLPRDHEVKLTAQTGWHFLVGSCWDAEGVEYGIEFMLFGDALFPPKLADDFGLTDLENLAVEMQFAISEKSKNHYQVEPLVADGTTGLIYSFAFDDLPEDIKTFTMEPIVEGGQSAFFAHGVQICGSAQ